MSNNNEVMHVIYESDDGCAWSYVAAVPDEVDKTMVLLYQGTEEFHCSLDEQWYTMDEAALLVNALIDILAQSGHPIVGDEWNDEIVVKFRTLSYLLRNRAEYISETGQWRAYMEWIKARAEEKHNG